MIAVRAASMEDAKTLFDWRNHPSTYALFHIAQPVEWRSHIQWLSSRLTRDTPHLYIAIQDGLPVGTFRIDGDEISYTVAPDRRGKGIGLAMLTKAREMFGPLRAEIYDQNAASIKIAMRAGMIVKIISHSSCDAQSVI